MILTLILNFIKRWIFSVNHKDIGILYLIFGCFSGITLSIFFFCFEFFILIKTFIFLISYFIITIFHLKSIIFKTVYISVFETLGFCWANIAFWTVFTWGWFFWGIPAWKFVIAFFTLLLLVRIILWFYGD